jgi:hypothetical protein
MTDDSDDAREREQHIERIQQALLDLRQKPFSFMNFEDLLDEAMGRIRADWEAETGSRKILEARRAKAQALVPKGPTRCHGCGGEVWHMLGWGTDDGSDMIVWSSCSGCGASDVTDIPIDTIRSVLQ